jgi:hypothetical protein
LQLFGKGIPYKIEKTWPKSKSTFENSQAYYVQAAKPSGYNALIVYNAKGQSPIPMSGSKFAELVQVPVVMVKYECMQSMLGHYSAEHGYPIIPVNKKKV